MPVRLRMTRDQCLVELQRPTSPYYSHFIVYLKSYRQDDGSLTNDMGKFTLVPGHRTFWGTTQDDWHIEEDMYYNRNGMYVKPVHVSLDDRSYFSSPLFARVKSFTPTLRVDQVVDQLNLHLDLYMDHLRDDIAEEWCSQEPWRVYPIKEYPMNDPRISIYGLLYDANPTPHDLKTVMGELMPKGYDEELPGDDIIN